MKKLFVLLVVLLCVLPETFAQGKGGGSSAERDQTVELNDVIERINEALNEVQGTPNFPELQSATISLETSYDRSGGGGFKIFVKAAGKWSKGTSSTITYKYEKHMKLLAEKAKNDELVEIIRTAAQAYQQSNSITGLAKGSFEVEVSFSITRTASGGIEFKVFGVEIGAEAEFEKTVAHSIVLAFK